MSWNKQQNRGRRNFPRGRKKKSTSIFTNRRNPNSNFVSLGDVISNIKERFYCWSHGIPEGGIIRWNNKGKIIGHTSRAKRPWFS